MKGKFQITGNVKLYEFPKNFTYQDFHKLSQDEREKFCVDSGDNLVVDAGLAQIIDLMIGTDTQDFTHCAVGSGTNTPAAGDTDLQTPIGSRLTVTNRYISGLTANFDTFYATGDNNGTWEETGIFSNPSGADMLCRRKFASSFTKATTNTALVAWTITLAAVAD